MPILHMIIIRPPHVHCTVGEPNKGHLYMVFQQSKIKKKSTQGRKLFCVDFDLQCKLEKCLERVEKGENSGELHTSRGVLNKGQTIRTRISRSKMSLGHFLTLVDNLEKKIFCFYHFAREIAVFSQFLTVGGLFFFKFFALAPRGVV